MAGFRIKLQQRSSDTKCFSFDALAFSNDQQLAGAILVVLTATIVFMNFVTDIILALIDPRVRQGLMG